MTHVVSNQPKPDGALPSVYVPESLSKVVVTT